MKKLQLKSFSFLMVYFDLTECNGSGQYNSLTQIIHLPHVALIVLKNTLLSSSCALQTGTTPGNYQNPHVRSRRIITQTKNEMDSSGFTQQEFWNSKKNP